MKYTLTILLILVTSIALAQTRPNWLDVASNPFVDVRLHGVKGDGATNDYAALKTAIELGGTIVIPAGLDIMIDGSDGVSYARAMQLTKSTHIMKKLLALVISLTPALLFSQELTANAPTLEIMRLKHLEQGDNQCITQLKSAKFFLNSTHS